MIDPQHGFLENTEEQTATLSLEWTLRLHFLQLFMNRFEWEGLPDEVPAYIIERQAFYYQTIVFFSTTSSMTGPYAALFCARKGPLDIYWRPTTWYIHGGNGFTADRNRENSVLLFDRSSHSVPYYMIAKDIDRLANIYQTADMNINAQKSPFVFTAPLDKKLTTFNMYEEITGNKPVIFRDNSKTGLNNVNIECLDLGVDFIGADLLQVGTMIENRILTRLGINNIPIEKKERLTMSEAESNNEVIKSTLNDCLTQREEFCEKINKMFGLNVSVKLKEPFGVEEENGQLYNGAPQGGGAGNNPGAV